MTIELNGRQIALYNLLKQNPNRRFQLMEIPMELPEFYPASPGGNFHNTGTRRKITADIQALNNSDAIEKVIIKDSNGVKLASEEEFTRYINNEYSSIFRRLARTRKKERKAGLDGQMRVPLGENEWNTIEAFVDDHARGVLNG